jgi:hypothetical protein
MIYCYKIMKEVIDILVYVPDIFLYLLGYGISSLIFPSIIENILNQFPKVFEDKQEPSVKLGALIGQLERLLILTAIFSNNYLLIPMLLTAKSIVRFPNISKNKTKNYAEYYLVGTLTSFLFAIMLGIIIVEYLVEYHKLGLS